MIICLGSNKKWIGFILTVVLVGIAVMLAYTISHQYSNSINNNILIAFFFTLLLLIIWVVVVSSVNKKGEIDITFRHIVIEEIDEFSLEKTILAKIPVDNIKWYSISYPTTFAAIVKFKLKNGRKFNFHLKRKIYFQDQSDLNDITSGIHNSVSEFNTLHSFNNIERRYSFFASKYGLLLMLILSICTFIMLLLLLKGAKGWMSFPILLGFILMAIAQRINERNDYKP